MVSDYIAAVLADSPAAFWELQDAADFPQDSSGNGNHMNAKSVVGSLTYRAVATSYGPASSFCTVQDRASLQRTTDTVLTAVNNVTMEIWLKSFTSGNTFLPFFVLGNISSAADANALGNNGWMLAISNAQHPIIRVLNGGSLSTSSAATFSLTSNSNWNQVVITRRAGTWEMWVNGAQDVGIGTFTSTPGAYSGQAVYICNADATAGHNISSDIAFASLYNSALSGTRITAHYNAMWQLENADYPEDSFLGLGSSGVTMADGAGVSIMRS